MKVRAIFEDGRLAMQLRPETEAERRMIGACIGEPPDPRNHFTPTMWPPAQVSAEVQYEGHPSNNKVSLLLVAIIPPSPSEQQ